MREWLNKHPTIDGMLWTFGVFALTGVLMPPLLYLFMVWWRLWLS